MSYEDDKLCWKDAARRILILQESSSDGPFNSNLNVILDELNSLDYATSVVDNEEVSRFLIGILFVLVYIYIYNCITIGSLRVDFRLEQCSIR